MCGKWSSTSRRVKIRLISYFPPRVRDIMCPVAERNSTPRFVITIFFWINLTLPAVWKSNPLPSHLQSHDLPLLHVLSHLFYLILFTFMTLNFLIKSNQLYAVSRTQLGKQREHSDKTLLSHNPINSKQLRL